jgi:hypothetical protein
MVVREWRKDFVTVTHLSIDNLKTSICIIRQCHFWVKGVLLYRNRLHTFTQIIDGFGLRVRFCLPKGDHFRSLEPALDVSARDDHIFLHLRKNEPILGTDLSHHSINPEPKTKHCNCWKSLTYRLFACYLQ